MFFDRFKKFILNMKNNSNNINKPTSKLKFFIIPIMILLLLVIGISNTTDTNIITALKNKILSEAGIYTEEIRNVEITSPNYSLTNPGSWHIDKSAEWIDDGKAQITFDVNSTVKRNEDKNDIILVLDTSTSMTEAKLEKVKEAVRDGIVFLLEDPNIKISIITFNSNSTIVSNFSNNEAELLEKIDSLTSNEPYINYNEALLNVDEVMKDYVKEENKEVITLFLSTGYPNIDGNAQAGTYEVLKAKYPYMTINAIQYGMGNDAIKEIKEMSDNQWTADLSSIHDVLINASGISLNYESFKVIDYIDKDNFYINTVDDITVSIGTVKLEEENSLQKITWDLGSTYNTGTRANMDININFKKNDVTSEIFSPTNDSEVVIWKLPTEEEQEVTSNETPVLKNYYNLTYLENAPSGCSVVGIPSSTKEKEYSTVDISNTEPTCEGYDFKGYEIYNRGVTKVTKTKFIMPDEDVVIKAIWSKVGITKTAEGQIYTGPAKIKSYTETTTTDFHDPEYASKIISASFVNYINLENAIELTNESGRTYWDLSYDNSGKVIGWLEVDGTDDTKYHLYIGTDGRKLWANEDSSYLFSSSITRASDYQFGNLKEIYYGNFDTSKTETMAYTYSNCTGLENISMGALANFDMSNVTDMTHMFYNCSSLTAMHMSGLVTSNVTNMSYMFYNCSKLIYLNLSGIDTSQVTNMSYMFYNCALITELDVSSFNTSNVTDMNYMFYGCWELKELDVDEFDTTQVTSMAYMFYNCENLTVLDLSKFITKNVTNMRAMFYGCRSLTNLNLINFDTSKVTNMSYMFYLCLGLTNLDLTSFKTEEVITMDAMFLNCSHLENVDLSSFTTPKLEATTSMFSGCGSLRSIDLSSFDMSKVNSKGGMFSRTNAVTTAYAKTQADADILNTDTDKPDSYTFVVKPITTE